MKKPLALFLALALSAPALAWAQTATLQHASTAALATSLVVETNPQHVLSAFGCTGVAGAAAGYCVAYNAASVPSTGSLTGAQVLDVCYFAASAAGCSFSRIPFGAMYSQGIVILLTSATSPLTYTTGTDTAFIWADYN